MNEREIALSALRAAGHDQAAALVEAIIPGATAPATTDAPQAAGLTPGQVYAAEQAATAAAAPQGPQPPAGKAALADLDEWEKLPQDERLARLDEADALYLLERKG